MGTKKHKAKERKALISRLDRAWSQKVREQGYCDLCGRRGDISSFDAHHIRGRANMATRFDLDNGACLCPGKCHRFGVHKDTLLASRLIDRLKERRGPDWYPSLLKKADEIWKPTTEELENVLSELEPLWPAKAAERKGTAS